MEARTTLKGTKSISINNSTSISRIKETMHAQLCVLKTDKLYFPEKLEKLSQSHACEKLMWDLNEQDTIVKQHLLKANTLLENLDQYPDSQEVPDTLLISLKVGSLH